MSSYALRLPDSLMEAAKRLAREDHTSLNQWIVTAIAEKVSAMETARFFEERAKRADPKAYEEIMRRVPARPPEPGDEIPGKHADSVQSDCGISATEPQAKPD